MPALSRSLVTAALAGALMSTGAVAITTTSAAAAGRENVNVGINLNDNSTKFTGKVGSKRESCTKGKTVTLFFSPGPGEVFEFDSDQSNSDGEWTIKTGEGQFPPGSYFVRVADSKNCQPAKSKTVMVPFPT